MPLLITVLWILAGLGILREILYGEDKYFWLGKVLYVLMALTILLALDYAALGSTPMVFMVLGFVAYGVGFGGFFWQKGQYSHTIWHVLVLVGSVCHYFAIWTAL